MDDKKKNKADYQREYRRRHNICQVKRNQSSDLQQQQPQTQHMQTLHPQIQYQWHPFYIQQQQQQQQYLPSNHMLFQGIQQNANYNYYGIDRHHSLTHPQTKATTQSVWNTSEDGYCTLPNNTRTVRYTVDRSLEEFKSTTPFVPPLLLCFFFTTSVA